MESIMEYRNQYGVTFIPLGPAADVAFHEPFVNDLEAVIANFIRTAGGVRGGVNPCGTTIKPCRLLVRNISASPHHPGMEKTFWVEPEEGTVDSLTVNAPHLLLAGAAGRGAWSVSWFPQPPTGPSLRVDSHRVHWILHQAAGAYERSQALARRQEGAAS
jgi:hypothetical protein